MSTHKIFNILELLHIISPNIYQAYLTQQQLNLRFGVNVISKHSNKWEWVFFFSFSVSIYGKNGTIDQECDPWPSVIILKVIMYPFIHSFSYQPLPSKWILDSSTIILTYLILCANFNSSIDGDATTLWALNWPQIFIS